MADTILSEQSGFPNQSRISNWSMLAPPQSRSAEFGLPDGRTLTLFIATPHGEPPANGWPCLVLLDGQRFFHSFAAAAETLADRPAKTGVGAMVIIGIGHRADDGSLHEQRIKDFTSAPCKECEEPQHVAGNAVAFRAVLLDQIMPDIIINTAINPTQISLFGHSLAGLFVLDTIAAAPRAFSRWISISPSLWWHSPDPTQSQQTLLLGCGEEENRRDMRRKITQWATDVPTNRAGPFFIAPRADHGSAPFALMPDILRWAYAAGTPPSRS